MIVLAIILILIGLVFSIIGYVTLFGDNYIDFTTYQCYNQCKKATSIVQKGTFYEYLRNVRRYVVCTVQYPRYIFNVENLLACERAQLLGLVERDEAQEFAVVVAYACKFILPHQFIGPLQQVVPTAACHTDSPRIVDEQQEYDEARKVAVNVAVVVEH